MTARILILALALAACGQTVETPAPEELRVEAPAPVPVRSDGEPCRRLETASDAAGMETLGVVSGYTISATRGALVCSEPALGRVDCSVAGPGEVHVSAQERIGFVLDEGQTGTFIVAPQGPRCFLNSNGG